MDWLFWNNKKTCGANTLKVNEACLQIVSNSSEPLGFFIRNTECYECDFTQQKGLIAPNTNKTFIISTNYGFESYLFNRKKFCESIYHFEDFGVYLLNATEKSCSNIKVLNQPEKLWFNIILLIIIYSFIVAMYYLLKFFYKHGRQYFYPSHMALRELETDLGSPITKRGRISGVYRKSRIRSLDAFRGLAIIIMIFVNYNGGDYSIFKHTPWNGLNLADLVFPWFVWVMGASTVFSLSYNLRASHSKKKIFCCIVKRSIMLIIFGILLNSGHRENGFLRVCGVLQRIGVTYFIIASLELFFLKPHRNEHFGPWYICQDVINSWVQWIFAIFIAIIHTYITFTLHVPGCPTGYLGPGGLSNHSLYKNCTGGAAGYIDRIVISNNHMYHRGSFVNIFKPTVPYDPEGILGILTSILCAHLGMQFSRVVLNYENSFSRIKNWFIWALVTGISAGFLCNWSKNSGIIPINKNLWSLSYVLACSSLAFFSIIIFYWLIDFTQIWSGYPFVYPGTNAITLYLGHSLLKTQLPWRWVAFTNTHLELLIMDITATAVWCVISYILYKYNVFITL